MPLFNRRQNFLDALNKSISQGQSEAQESLLAKEKSDQAVDREKQITGNNIQLVQDLKNKLDSKEKGHRYNVGVSAGGGVTLGEGQADDFSKLVALLGLKERQDARNDRDVTKVGERVQKEDIPQVAGQLKEIKDSLPPEGQPMKSYGPVLNAVPDWGISIGEALKLLPKGARRERQALEAGKSMVRHPLYGATLTGNEKQSFESAFGAPIGGSEEDVRAAVRRMGDIPLQQMQNIEASTRPPVMKTYADQGGMNLNKLKQMLGVTPTPSPAPAPSAAPAMSFEEFKARKAAGKL